MMNFVVFGWAETARPKAPSLSPPRKSPRLRKRALATQSLIAARATVVGGMLPDDCAVPKSMNFFYDGQEQAAR